jgi:hypothetical protein
MCLKRAYLLSGKEKDKLKSISGRSITALKMVLQKADKDITVYKVFIKGTLGIYTPYRGFPMEVGQMYYQTEKEVHKRFSYALDYHPREAGFILTVNKGLHSYISRDIAIGRNAIHFNPTFKFSKSEYVVHKCKVPQGASYIVNHVGEIASDKLIIGKEVSCEIV